MAYAKYVLVTTRIRRVYADNGIGISKEWIPIHPMMLISAVSSRGRTFDFFYYTNLLLLRWVRREVGLRQSHPLQSLIIQQVLKLKRQFDNS